MYQFGMIARQLQCNEATCRVSNQMEAVHTGFFGEHRKMACVVFHGEGLFWGGLAIARSPHKKDRKAKQCLACCQRNKPVCEDPTVNQQ